MQAFLRCFLRYSKRDSFEKYVHSMSTSRKFSSNIIRELLSIQRILKFLRILLQILPNIPKEFLEAFLQKFLQTFFWEVLQGFLEKFDWRFLQKLLQKFFQVLQKVFDTFQFRHPKFLKEFIEIFMFELFEKQKS